MAGRSGHSSRGSAGSTSASSEQGFVPSGKSRKTPTVEPSSQGVSPKPSVSRTSGGLERAISRASAFCAEASLARISRQRELEQALPAPARVFGPSLPGSLANYDLATSSWRTSLTSSRAKAKGGTEPPSDEFLATYPKWGMTRSGRCFRLESSGHPTCASESGLLPTPTATSYGSNRGGAAGRVGKVRHSLESMARQGEWPTPTVKGNYNRAGYNSRSRDGLAVAVEKVEKLWPTPRAHPSGPDYARAGRKGSGGDDLVTAVQRDTPGRLNPTWVEWLMGFPLEWTALEPSGMPSSRRSRSGSDNESSPTRRG